MLVFGFRIVFDKGCVKIFLDNIYYGSGYLSNDFIVLDTVNILINDNTSIYVVGNFSTSNDNDSVIWHARLGHIGQDCLKRLAKVGLLGSLAKVKLPICEHCLVEKAIRLPFDKAKRAISKSQLIHSDICAQWMWG